ESPYPRNYQQAGIPLPGPSLAAPLARPQLNSIVEEPRASKVSEAPVELDETETPAPSPPAVSAPAAAEEKMPLWQSAAKPLEGASPFPKATRPETSQPRKRQPQQEATQAPATVVEKRSSAEDDEPVSPSDQQQSPKIDEQAAARPDSAALVGLFASLGGNAFLIWVATGQRSRYRSLLRRSHEALAAASADKLPSAADDSPRWEEVPPDDDLRDEA
ncbi:MAG TPA: hypothetical protein VFX03_12980, partial [Thermomicrobiales bacterium]|nr:hypothetical protein [Thermomicrobiales bacterium]